MKIPIIYIETEKKTYPLVFNLNVMEEIQEKYGSMDKWGELTKGTGEVKVKDLRYGFTLMMNEAIDMENEDKGVAEPLLTERQVGRIMSEVGVDVIVKKIQEVTIASAKSKENTEKNE